MKEDMVSQRKQMLGQRDPNFCNNFRMSFNLINFNCISFT